VGKSKLFVAANQWEFQIILILIVIAILILLPITIHTNFCLRLHYSVDAGKKGHAEAIPLEAA
jgi:hypothetical protein